MQIFKLFAILAVIVSFSCSIKGQNLIGNKVDTSFNKMISHYDEIYSRFYRDSLKLPILYTTKQYKIVLADSAWHLTKKQLWLENPFSSDPLDRYPLSYSVFYQNRLVSLFAPGSFICYKIDNWERDLLLEKQFNTKRFEHHMLIDGQLIGFAGKKYWQFSSEVGWKQYHKSVPFKKQTKLYEDTNYIVYSECQGEFGGRIFFYDKQTTKTYSTKSVCAVWVRHTSQGYEVVSNLGHMMGSAGMQLISDPRSLPLWQKEHVNRKSNDDQLAKPSVLFSFSELQLFGGFQRQNKVVYLLHSMSRTCLATLSVNTFMVVDPLFNDNLYTHNPVSTSYEGVDIINLDYNSLGGEREVFCLVIKNNLVTLLIWH